LQAKRLDLRVVKLVPTARSIPQRGYRIKPTNNQSLRWSLDPRHAGKDVVGEVKSVEEVGVRFACRGARSRGDRRRKIEVDPKRRGLCS